MTAATQNWRIAPYDPTHVFFDGVAKPINCGTAERARLIAAAPDLVEALRAAHKRLRNGTEMDQAFAAEFIAPAISRATA